MKFEQTPHNSDSIDNADLHPEDLSGELKKEKVETFPIEIVSGKNFELEAKIKNFDYPKDIQQETGILGYERMTVSGQAIFSYYKEFCQESYGIDLAALGVDSYADLSAFFADLPSTWRNKEIPEEDKERIDRLGEKLGDKDKRLDIWRDYRELIERVLMVLSKEQYPKMCLTHKFGVAGESAQRGKNRDAFVDDRLFLQKIYDVDRIEKKRLEGDTLERIYNYAPDHPDSNFTLYEKDTGKHILEEPQHIGKISDYKNDLGTKYYAATPDGGLYMNPGSFFHSIRETDIGFGFPVIEDDFFREYLKKSVTILLETEGYEQRKPSFSRHFSLVETFALYLVSEYEKAGYPWGSAESGWTPEFFKEKIKEISKDFFRQANLPDGFEANDIKIEAEAMGLVDMYAFPKEFKLSGHEKRIPIFIGHDEIPQLAWGHAKYAHYFNEKGLNFFTFKHADHLPVKHTENQDLNASTTLKK